MPGGNLRASLTKNNRNQACLNKLSLNQRMNRITHDMIQSIALIIFTLYLATFAIAFASLL